MSTSARRVTAMPQAVFQITVFLALCVLYGGFLAQPIDLTTADLGRHLKNGELFFQHHVIPRTNLYSYTYPDYPFLNHHWASGVVLYAIERLTGFTGLSLFFIGVSLMTFFLFFRLAWKSAGFPLAALTAVLVIPVLASRREIRPELFSSLFSGVFFWVLWHYRQHTLSRRWLVVLPLIECGWVNLHIYFFVGLLLVAVFLLEAVLVRGGAPDAVRSQRQALGLVFLVTVLATLVNPSGVAGAIHPFQIYHNHGYRVFEEQSAWFIERLFRFPSAIYFKLTLAVLLGSWVFAFIKRTPLSVANGILSVFSAVLGSLMIRHFVLFGYFALPLIATNLHRGQPRPWWSARRAVGLVAMMGLLTAGLVALHPPYWPTRGTLGLGVKPGVANAIEFFQRARLQGPILNNYDIGSYLIYYLYPTQRVFVDNRPESYPAEFFKQVYIPLQTDEIRWKEADQRYQFDVIFFYRLDATPWGQDFLIRRVFDPAWAPVYVDASTIILVKRSGPNHSIAETYELPKSLFTVRRLR